MWNRIRALLDRVSPKQPTRAVADAPEFGEALVGDRHLIETAHRVDQWRSAHTTANAPSAVAAAE
jgi:hypothetical protein